jgi:adenylate cyclase class 2
MAEEIEAKVRLDSPGAFRRRVQAAGGQPQGRVSEVNRLFDDAAGTLRRRGAALRVRQEYAFPAAPGRSQAAPWRSPDGRALRASLTYKGPQAEGPLKRRQEIEAALDAADAAIAILQAIGLSETFRYEKRRETWRLGPCEVTLDELPRLGHFAEVEGPNQRAIRKALADLGLAQAPLIRDPYVALLEAHLKAAGLDPTRAVFGDE